MPQAPKESEGFRRRLVGMYALHLMEREGELYGYRLSEAIAEKTQGAWRPGPGSVYPSLQKLVASGLATSKLSGRRRTYAITRKGSSILRTIRARSREFSRGSVDGTMLWAEIQGDQDAGDLLIRHLHHTWDVLEGMLDAQRGTASTRERLRERTVAELTQALARFSQGSPSQPRGHRGGSYA